MRFLLDKDKRRKALWTILVLFGIVSVFAYGAAGGGLTFLALQLVAVSLGAAFIVVAILAAGQAGAFRQRQPEPDPIPWWKPAPRGGRVVNCVQRYTDPEKMDFEIRKVSAHGWTVKHVATLGSHINVGRTVAPAVLTGGLSLLLGASRTKETYVVTFEHAGE